MYPNRIKNMRGNPDKYGLLLADDENSTEREWLKSLLVYMLSSYGFGGIPLPLGTRNVICAIEGTPLHADLEKLRVINLIAVGNRQGKWRMYHMTCLGLASTGMPIDIWIRAIRAAKKFHGGRKIFPLSLWTYKKYQLGIDGVWSVPE